MVGVPEGVFPEIVFKLGDRVYAGRAYAIVTPVTKWAALPSGTARGHAGDGAAERRVVIRGLVGLWDGVVAYDLLWSAEGNVSGLLNP